MSAVDVTMTAAAAAILFLVPAFIGVSLPIEQSPLSGAQMSHAQMSGAQMRDLRIDAN
ncbi:hypothetical protein [Streptomyces sp. PA5.6]|uniref:hypothetical protein n=1 Tax=Streptomyces sp. PA5.6 TaxID=3035651 RepID=UPI003904B43F